MTSVIELPSAGSSGTTTLPRGPRPLPLVCKLCHALHPATASATCEECLGPLEPVYDAGRTLPDAATITARPRSLWRYREWLPFEGEPAVSLDTVGCASTGNLANAVAAQAARAGLPAWIFIPYDLELGKVVGTAVYNPHLVRVRGTYDDVNRLCSQVADRFGWGLVNINLRGYYGEGSKTMAFEIAEQLGWRLPTAVVAPMVGGSLLTKLE